MGQLDRHVLPELGHGAALLPQRATPNAAEHELGVADLREHGHFRWRLLPASRPAQVQGAGRVGESAMI